jgi:hypothetical protein
MARRLSPTISLPLKAMCSTSWSTSRGDQQVAAAAQHQARQRGERGVGGQRRQLARARHAQVAPRARRNAEGVELLEGNVVFDGQCLHGWVRKLAR